MATTTNTTAAVPAIEKEPGLNNGDSSVNSANLHQHQAHTHDRSHEPGYINDYGRDRQTAYATGGSLQPGMWKPYEHRKFANPAPLGLSAFALTTFVLSCVNMHARGVAEPNVVVPLAFGYGGLVQLLAGMWEMAVGNTFGATALSSYGGFWISYAILLTPNWQITAPTGPYEGDVASPIGFFLTGWFIFTTILVICTLRSTVAFFSLFFTLDLAFLFLACEQYASDMGKVDTALGLQKAGGFFGFLAAFLAWYCALAGIQDSSNSFFSVPVIHFPWSDKGRELRKAKSAEHTV
jgi:succinate-acetate transporter protein